MRAGLVIHPREHRWSSYHRQALERPDDLPDDDPWYGGLVHAAHDRQQVYRDWMEVFVKEEEWNQIHKATHQGRVVGYEAFQEQMGSNLGQRPKEETAVRSF